MDCGGSPPKSVRWGLVCADAARGSKNERQRTGTSLFMAGFGEDGTTVTILQACLSIMARRAGALLPQGRDGDEIGESVDCGAGSGREHGNRPDASRAGTLLG